MVTNQNIWFKNILTIEGQKQRQQKTYNIKDGDKQ